MRAKGDVTTINNIIIEAIHIHKLEYCHGRNSKESLGFYDKEFYLKMTMRKSDVTHL